MTKSYHPGLPVIAREAGFGSRERMRRAFIRRFGQAPKEIRRDARSGDLRAPPRFIIGRARVSAAGFDANEARR